MFVSTEDSQIALTGYEYKLKSVACAVAGTIKAPAPTSEQTRAEMAVLAFPAMCMMFLQLLGMFFLSFSFLIRRPEFSDCLLRVRAN